MKYCDGTDVFVITNYTDGVKFCKHPLTEDNKYRYFGFTQDSIVYMTSKLNSDDVSTTFSVANNTIKITIQPNERPGWKECPNCFMGEKCTYEIIFSTDGKYKYEKKITKTIYGDGRESGGDNYSVTKYYYGTNPSLPPGITTDMFKQECDSYY